jgi:uroporphyrinogen-III synthase
MVELVVAREVDALTFTSAPAAVSLLRTAGRLGREDDVLQALRTDVLPVCVGPVTAAPLERAGVRTRQPERSRLGALVREVVAELPRRSRTLPVAGHELQVRGYAALVDGRLRPLPPGPMAVLRALAARPGRVVPRAELLRVLAGGAVDEHAVEMAVGRLRTALGDPRIVQTVVKRGYRLAFEPERETTGCLDLTDVAR